MILLFFFILLLFKRTSEGVSLISFLCVIKVSGLQEGISYRLRIHAKNLAGVGVPSKATDAILAETRPGEVLSRT